MAEKDIVFTKHARKKFVILRRHAFSVSVSQVTTTIRHPDLIDTSRTPLLIAQKRIDDHHVLRVVYKQEFGIKTVITFYPGRRTHYEREE